MCYWYWFLCPTCDLRDNLSMCVSTRNREANKVVYDPFAVARLRPPSFCQLDLSCSFRTLL
jgi:hypothetical protein